jgi:hypothetical protein
MIGDFIDPQEKGINDNF